MKALDAPWRSFIKRTTMSIAARMVLWPSNYKYHALLEYVLRGVQQRQANKSIGIFAINSNTQFASGEVYNYKNVVKSSGNEIQVNLDLARERLYDIFLKKEVTQYLKMSGDESLLEVGCEAGQNLAVIREALPDMQLSGCDISPTALTYAMKAGFPVREIDLLDIDSLAVYQDEQFDYVLVSHVMEHLVVQDIEATKTIRQNVLKHIHRIAKRGYILTAPIIAQDPVPIMLSFIGHKRVALSAFSIADLDQLGILGFFITSNPQDQSISIVVAK